MSRILSYILTLLIFAGGIVVAVLSNDTVVMCIGIAISVFTLVTSILTNRDIEELQERARNAVYLGDVVEEGVEINNSFLDDCAKK